MLDASDEKDAKSLVGTELKVIGAVELYEIVDLDDRDAIEFAQVVVGRGYAGPEIKRKVMIPRGTILKVRKVIYQVVPFDSSYVLMVELSPSVINSSIPIRLPLTPEVGLHMDKGIFEPVSSKGLDSPP